MTLPPDTGVGSPDYEAPPAPSPGSQGPHNPAAVLRIGRGTYRVLLDFPAALVEAHVVSTGSQRRPVYVLSLADYFEGNRRGYVILERPAADLFGAVVAIVVAV